MPHDAFTSRLSQQWQERVSPIGETMEGTIWASEGQKWSRFGYEGPGPTAGQRGTILIREGFAGGCRKG